MGYPLNAKKEWLADQVAIALNKFGSDVDTLYGSSGAAVKVENRPLPWHFQWFQNRMTRKSVMGSPMWYAEILHSGPTTVLKATSDGRPFAFSHTFIVNFYLEYKEPDDPGNSSVPDGSTKLFDSVTDAQIDRDGKDGLLVALRNLGLTYVDEGSVRHPLMLVLSDDVRDVVFMNESNPRPDDKCHTLAFVVQIDDAL